MYTLYYKSGACSMAPHVLLNELNIPFEAKKVEAAEMKSPEFLKLNPRGQIPLLIVDGEPVKEGAAIMIWLLDTHDKDGAWMPKSGLPRAKALEWLAWCNASLHPACGKIFGLAKMDLDDATKDKLKPLFMTQVQSLWDEAETRLGKTKYLAGDKMTVADILLTVIAGWGVGAPGANVKRVMGEVMQRPSWSKTRDSESGATRAAA